jgi:serine protease
MVIFKQSMNAFKGAKAVQIRLSLVEWHDVIQRALALIELMSKITNLVLGQLTRCIRLGLILCAASAVSLQAASLEIQLTPNAASNNLELMHELAAKYQLSVTSSKRNGHFVVELDNNMQSRALAHLQRDSNVLWAEPMSTVEATAPKASARKSMYHPSLMRLNFIGGEKLTAAQISLAVLPNLAARTGLKLSLKKQSSLGWLVQLTDKKRNAEQLATVAEALAADPAIANAERVVLLRAFATPAVAPTNDPLFPYQWALHKSLAGINAVDAWTVTKGDGVVVAVVDTGFRPHPELANKIVPGFDFVSDKQLSNDGNGRDNNAIDDGDYVDFLDEAYRYPYTEMSSWHGTHVSGIIAASANNSEGMSGVSWGARIQPVRVLAGFGGSFDDVIDGMRWAAGLPVPGVPMNKTPAKVLNLSLGGESDCTESMQLAVNEILAKGSAIVASAGNEAADVRSSAPANCRGVISVAAGGDYADLASYSNYGRGVKLMAPGGDGNGNGQILSTLDSGVSLPSGAAFAGYAGTSMAAPHVAGVLALMLSRNPSLTPAQMLLLLQTSARPFPEGSVCSLGISQEQPLCGAGMLDAYRAVISTNNTRLAADSAPLGRVKVVELYDQDYGRYLYSTDPVEVKQLEAGGLGGRWARTGETLTAYAEGALATLNAVPHTVCRLAKPRGNVELHYFSVNQSDCANAAMNGWEHQGYPFRMALANDGVCETGSRAVYQMVKLDEQGNALTYRYFTDSTTYFFVEANLPGWVGMGRTMCAPI